MSKQVTRDEKPGRKEEDERDEDSKRLHFSLLLVRLMICISIRHACCVVVHSTASLVYLRNAYHDSANVGQTC